MALLNSPTTYGAVAKLLHWLIALVIILMLAAGKFMTDLEIGQVRFDLTQLHKSIGLTILGLTLLRILWRLLNRQPALPAHMSALERLAAKFTHLVFYVLMLAIPLSGWALASASKYNIPTVYFGTVEVPHLPYISTLPRDEKKDAEDIAEEAHELLANLMILLLALHIAAALKHHWWNRDDVLTRMLPFARKKE